MTRVLSSMFKVVMASIVLTAGVTIGWPTLGRSQGESESTEALQVTDKPLTVMGALSAESEVLAEDGTYYNAHTFRGETGQTIIISMTSDEFDTYLLLLEPNGNVIAQNDDGTDGTTNSQIAIALPETGTYTLVANSYTAGETGAYALSIRRNTAARTERIGQTESLAEAEQLNQQVMQLYQEGRYAEATSIAERVLEIREAMLDENHSLIASSLSNLGLLYKQQGRYDDAEVYLQRALSIYEVLGDEHSEIAKALSNLAGLYLAVGRYTEAEPLLVRSLAIREQTLPERHPDIAINLNNLAEVYRSMGRYTDAESLFLQSLSICEDTLGINHPNTAAVLHNLAALYQAQGRFVEAEEHYLRALKIREASLPPDHPDIAISLNNIGWLYQAQGRYPEAEDYYLKALQIFQDNFGEEHTISALILNNLATLYQDQGRYQEAEDYYLQALDIRQRKLPENHPDVATGFDTIAILYQVLGQYNKAENFYLRALRIREAIFPEMHPDIASTLGHLADLYREQKRYEESEAYYLRALHIREAILPDNHPDTALNINNMGILYLELREYEKAEESFQRSLSIWQQQLGAEHPRTSTVLVNLAGASWATARTETAFEFLSQALSIEELNLNLVLGTGSETRKEAYIATIAGSIDLAIAFNLQASPNSSTSSHLALETILRRKGRVLDAVTDNLQLLRQNLDTDSQNILNNLQSTRSQLVALRFRGPGDQPPEAYQAELNRLEVGAEELSNILAQRSAEFRVESELITVADVQAQLPTDAILIEFFRYQPFNPTASSQSERWGYPRYAAYILRPDGTTHGIDLGEAEPIDQAVTTHLNQLQRPDSLNATRAAGRTLDDLILQPIRPYLGNAQHLLISPDGQLNLIPFAALVDENDQYLIENYTLTTLASGRDLLKLQLDRPSQQDPVIVANPDFNTANSLIAEIPPSHASSTRNTDTQRSTDLATLDFAPLPGTQIEAEAIAPLLPNATLLTGADATEAALTQLNAPSILHLATHGYFLNDVAPIVPSSRGDDGTIEFAPTATPLVQENIPLSNENPLLRSGLALANFNPPRDEPGTNDGVLSALEVSSLNLYGTDLVVLSACETGVGDVVNGEGVYGLRRAFALAGAESLLMSLWKVDDYGTAELMRRYYDRLINDNEGRGEALRQVQLELLNAPAYEHPYYWAAFMLSGDWHPLNE